MMTEELKEISAILHTKVARNRKFSKQKCNVEKINSNNHFYYYLY